MGIHDNRGRRPLASVVALWSLSIVLVLTGCSVGPKFEKPEVALNESWNQTDPQMTAALPDTSWWKAFNDPALDRLIELAYHQNLPLEVAGLRILESRAQLQIAVGRQYPQVQAVFGSATAVGLSENAASSFPGMDRYFWDYQLGFDAAWEMDFWGKFRHEVQAETAEHLATVADYDNALVSLTAEVARTYAVYRTFEVLLEQAQHNATLQEEGLRIADARHRNGATSELDVTQATTLLESTRATIPQLEIGVYQTQNSLSTLLGQPTGSVTALLEGPKVIPAAPASVAVSVPAELLRRRPDVRSAELSAVAQCARIGVAKADLYPSLILFGSIGVQASSGAHAPSGSLFNSGSVFYSFGPRLIWPLFNYGRIKNNVRVQDARLQQLLVEYQDTALKAAQEVEDGLIGYLKAQEATVFAQNAANAAQRSVDLAVVQYREGAVDYQRVLDAQRSLLEEQNTLTQTQSSIATNLIALYKALGGGWELRVGQPVVSDSTRVEMENRTNWGDYFTQPPPDTTNVITPTDSTSTDR